jgi:hypothetical protein
MHLGAYGFGRLICFYLPLKAPCDYLHNRGFTSELPEPMQHDRRD